MEAKQPEKAVKAKDPKGNAGVLSRIGLKIPTAHTSGSTNRSL